MTCDFLQKKLNYYKKICVVLCIKVFYCLLQSKNQTENKYIMISSLYYIIDDDTIIFCFKSSKLLYRGYRIIQVR